MRPYYQDDAVTIYHGDSLALVQELPEVDHFIQDPPYSDHVHSNSKGGTSAATRVPGAIAGARQRDLGFPPMTYTTMQMVATAAERLCRRWFLTFSDVESCHLWRIALEQAGLDYARTGAWVKLGATPQFTGDRPATGFEPITICHAGGRKRWNGGGKHAIWRDVWEVPIIGGGHDDRTHETQKPLSLMGQLLQDFTDPGETVLDMFMGGGTTLAAAKRLGRLAIGVDMREECCELAARSLEQVQVEHVHATLASGRWRAKQSGSLFDEADT